MTINHTTKGDTMKTITKFNPTEPSAHVGRWIESYGAEHELVEVDIEVIDVASSLNNQARQDPMDADVARIYRDAMKAGAIFPPLVGYFYRESIILIDGNHRASAAIMAGATSVWVHIVISDELTILDMVASANAILNGKEAAGCDRLRHGMRMVAAGSTLASAARQVSVSSSNLAEHIKADTVRNRGDSLGLRHIVSGMKVGHLARIMPVVDDLDRELLMGLSSAAGASSTVHEFGELVKRIKPMDAGDRVTAVATFSDQHARTINARPSASGGTKDPARLFVMHAKAIVLTGAEPVASGTPTHRRDEVKKLADDLRYVASQIERSL